MKLTWTKLFGSNCIVDPACHGTGYHLRYRRRKGGMFAELRHKAGPGTWKSHRLGRVPTEEEARMVPWLTAPFGLVNQLPDDFEPVPVPVEKALEPIRKRARELLAQIQAGQNPRDRVSSDTLKAVAEWYLRTQAKRLRPRTLAEVERHLLQHWAPLHGKPIAEITRKDFADHLERLAAERGPVAALRSRTSLRTLFDRALDAGRIEQRPPLPSKRVIGHEERARDRKLSCRSCGRSGARQATVLMAPSSAR